MIVSQRPFGIEIEFRTDKVERLRTLSKILPITEDGSIRHLKYSGEYVSPVLVGDKGVGKLYNDCSTLKEHNAKSEDTEMSVHVHLDGGLGKGKLIKTYDRPDERPCIGLSPTAQAVVDDEVLRTMLDANIALSLPGMRENRIENVYYYSKASLSNHPKSKFMYVWQEKNDRFEWLQRVFYFYTQYSDVMENIVSRSRRFGNMYCIPLGKSYSLKEIEKAKNMDDLRRVWYKDIGTSGRYNDSRYHNVNLHSFFNKNGTVELRSHGGTIDPYKILLWVRLHQHILDKLERVTLSDIKTRAEKNQAFVDFIEDDILKKYVKRLLGYYSNITVK